MAIATARQLAGTGRCCQTSRKIPWRGVDAEFERSVLFAGLVGWLDHEKAPIAGLEEFLGEAVGLDDFELRRYAGRPPSRQFCQFWHTQRVEDFGDGVSRLEERVIACNKNGRIT